MTEIGRYSVVKFVPDRIRFEPVNVGLIASFGDRDVAKMSEDLDPRIRFADPYADTASLLHTLRTFDIRDFASADSTGFERLASRSVELPNLYVDRPNELAVDDRSFEVVVEALFDRLVVRRFALPAGFHRQIGPTMARTALRDVFAQSKTLGPIVRADVTTLGKSGVVWNMDFQYLSDQVCLIQTATTGLRENLRRSEHAFRAFAALVDTAHLPGNNGILAVDEPADANEASGQLKLMASAHGLQFFGGRRGFLELAQKVSRDGRPLDDRHMESQQVQLSI
jgi:hypothetical protein